MNISHIGKVLRQNYRSRCWWARQFNGQIFGRLNNIVAGNDGVAVMEEDWDNLVVLDGCRYDLFQSVIEDDDIHLSGSLTRARSRASATVEFLTENFAGGTFHDTVYLTANPQLQLIEGDSSFHRVYHAWREDWDEKLETVLPETMVDLAINLHAEHPNKRLIAHLMQPHYPFIGETRLETDRYDANFRDMYLDRDADGVNRIWDLLGRGEVDSDAVWAAYRDNLRRALQAVEQLLDELPGKTIITSDHGNGFGERHFPFPFRIYGHPKYVHTPELVDVPWFEASYDERRSVEEGEPEEGRDDTPSEEMLKDRLNALGYQT